MGIKWSFVLLLLVVIQFSELSAQTRGRVIILSPRVGAVIDSVERERFNIFSAIPNFQSAEILLCPDSSYYAHIKVTSPAGSMDTLMIIPKPLILQTAEKIDHYEALLKGTYKMGSRPVIVKDSEGNTVLYKAASASGESGSEDASDELPLSKRTYAENEIKFPQICFQGGVSLYGADLSSINSLVGDVVQEVSQRGYLFSLPTVSFSMNTYITWGLKIRISGKLDIQGEVGRAGKLFGARLFETDVMLNTLSASLFYHPFTFNSPQLDAFIGPGIDYYNLEVHKIIPTPQVQSSDQNEPKGRYIQSIDINGSSVNTGFHWCCGFEILNKEHSAGLTLIGRYLYVPQMKLKNDNSTGKHEAKVNLSSFTLGLNLTLYLRNE